MIAVAVLLGSAVWLLWDSVARGTSSLCFCDVELVSSSSKCASVEAAIAGLHSIAFQQGAKKLLEYMEQHGRERKT